jgi:hypothetical protein
MDSVCNILPRSSWLIGFAIVDASAGGGMIATLEFVTQVIWMGKIID